MNSRLRWRSLTSALDLPGKQVDSGRQAQRAMTFVLVIPREGRVDAGPGRQIGCGGCDGLDSRLFVVGNDRHSPDGFARRGGSSLRHGRRAITLPRTPAGIQASLTRAPVKMTLGAARCRTKVSATRSVLSGSRCEFPTIGRGQNLCSARV
jgi:hypothetical protein